MMSGQFEYITWLSIMQKSKVKPAAWRLTVQLFSSETQESQEQESSSVRTSTQASSGEREASTFLAMSQPEAEGQPASAG